MPMNAKKTSILCICIAALASALTAAEGSGGAKAGNFTDTRDRQRYSTVKIDTLTWFAENLNYKTGNSACYEGGSQNCDAFGRLYDWNSALEACPSGWHLPSSEEWGSLIRAAGGTEAAGRALKSQRTWQGGGGGTDSYGFKAMPGGEYHNGRSFTGLYGYAYFWSATEGRDTNSARGQYMSYSTSRVSENNYKRITGASVRCVQGPAEAKAAPPPPPAPKPAASTFFTDARDKRKYRAVKIGKQTWMAENLDYAADSSWCFEDNEDKCKKLGRLYNWEAAVKSCPKGWHLPSREEWNELVETAGGRDSAGNKLKAVSDNDGKGRGRSTDEFGFSALFGGVRMSAKQYHYGTDYGNWWTATEREDKTYKAYYRDMYSGQGRVVEEDMDKKNAVSVRCVKD